MKRIALLALSLLIAGPSFVRAGDLPARCALEPVNGECKAMIQAFRYDAAAGRCRPYVYDGCGPVVPFHEMAECRTLCEPADGLKIAGMRPVEGLPFVHVEMEYPAAWADNPEFSAQVDGRDVAFREVGGGSTPETRSTTLEVFLGNDPATRLEVSAASGGRTHSVSAPVAWKPAPIVLLLDHPGDDEALFGPTSLRFFVFDCDTPHFRLNGADVPAEHLVGRPGGPGLWRIEPAWKPGRNVVAAEAAAADGARAAREYSFVDLAGGRLAVGEHARLTYGEEGSRSGPFYSLEVAGDAAKLGESSTVEVHTIDAKGWFGRTGTLVREVIGAAPGEATLRIVEKPHFLQPERVIREIRLYVGPAGK